MYLHIGGDTVIPCRDIIAIINISTAGRSSSTKDFFASQDEKMKEEFKDKNLKSCIITGKNIYYSSISSNTLVKRAFNLVDMV
ncbi:MAG: extracellular matrix regulatory protein [Clostridia bacterium]|nr:extracellular matrix regulatory protein [Clostridia bacterium]